MTKEELKSELGKPLTDRMKILRFEDLSEARANIRKIVEQYFDFIEDPSDVLLTTVEAMTNALKHAREVSYQVFKSNSKAQFLIADKGGGIDFKALPKATLLSGYSTKKTLGVGFSIMLEISSRIMLASDKSGTSIVLEVKPAVHKTSNHLNEIKISR